MNRFEGNVRLLLVLLLAVMFLAFIEHSETGAEPLGITLLADSLGWEGERPSPGRLTIDVLADGQIEVAGQVIGAAELDACFRRMMAATTGNLEVQILGSRDVPFGHVAPVMAACARADVWTVSISTKE